MLFCRTKTVLFKKRFAPFSRSVRLFRLSFRFLTFRPPFRTSISDVCAVRSVSFSPSCFHVSVRRDETARAAAASVETGVLFSALSLSGRNLSFHASTDFFAIRRDLFRLVERGSLFAVQKRLKNLRFRARRLLSRFLSFRRCTACACVGCRCNSVRSAAYAVGNGIPVVGGSIGESMSAVFASAEAVAKNIGVFGAVAVVLLPFFTAGHRRRAVAFVFGFGCCCGNVRA